MLGVMPSEHSITTDAMTPLHDAQSTRDTRELPIDKVGVRGLRFPIQVRDRAQVVQNTIATVCLFVDLPSEFKGTHRSLSLISIRRCRRPPTSFSPFLSYTYNHHKQDSRQWL